MKDPFLDKDFLYELNQFQHKDIYARIIVLNFDEMPLEQIEGRLTGGSINIDGNSAVRRTCNLSLVAKDVNINDFYWSIGSKFKVYIGVNNVINSNYPDIIWFNQGIYVIGSFNSSLSGNNYSISIGGKDKMCLLNGDMGGSLPASIDFGIIDTYNHIYELVDFEDELTYEANKYYTKQIIDDKEVYVIALDKYVKGTDYYEKTITLTQEQLTIENIIREAVHTYGKEPYHNIIINDLADYGLELMEYRGDEPLYLFYNVSSGTYDQMITQSNAEKVEIWISGDSEQKTTVDKLEENQYNSLVDDFNEGVSFTFKDGEQFYTVAKVEYGDSTGYRPTDLVYAGELISSIGESLTSILDKIKNMLGAFEYFYDIDGRFIFQAKKIYSNNSWNTLKNDSGHVYARDAVDESEFAYSFEDVNLIQKFSNQPTLNNLKNDYSVWGTRKTATGSEIPIHSRYAIHKKPTYYKAFDGKIYCSDLSIFEEINQIKKDEIIKDLNDRVQKFEPKYRDTMPTYLDAPWKNADGSWTAGWWDIRDWHDYYVALRQEEPKYTMKWYSRNDQLGCQRLKSILGPQNNSYYDNAYVWLLIINPITNTVNPQHGFGNPASGGRTCVKYESYYDKDGKLITKVCDPREEKWFIQPYSGCSDNHTYLEFLEGDIKRDKNLVYFYNPNFPGVTSFEEAVEEQVNKEYQEMIDNGMINLVDWREIIYRMALDYYKYNQDADFAYHLSNNNLLINESGSYYPNGITGYEMFYEDIQGFWRQLYNYDILNDDKKLIEIEALEAENKELIAENKIANNSQIKKNLKQIYDLKTNMEYIEYENIGGDYITETFYKITSLSRELVNKFNKEQDSFKQQQIYFQEPDADKRIEFFDNSRIKAGLSCYTNVLSIRDANNTAKLKEQKDYIKDNKWTTATWWKPHEWGDDPFIDFYLPSKQSDINLQYWNKGVVEAPELLNFWLDFYDIESEIGQYGISVIGNRPKVVNDSKITSIYFRSVPEIIFVYGDSSNLDRKTGYTYIQLSPGMEDLFTISAQGKSAEEYTNELFNKHSYCIENINITSIPIYNLDANTLIYIHNEENKINGKYQVSKISLPLTYNGTMSISATKIIDPII